MNVKLFISLVLICCLVIKISEDIKEELSKRRMKDFRTCLNDLAADLEPLNVVSNLGNDNTVRCIGGLNRV